MHDTPRFGIGVVKINLSNFHMSELFLQFLNVPAFRNVTLQCLTEIGKFVQSVFASLRACAEA